MPAGSLPHWNLSTIYPNLNWDAFRAVMGRLREGLDSMDSHL
jgi:hypothetical protein